MHVARMTVRSSTHPAFGKDIELAFDERVNLFVGPNACGKTSLLRVLAATCLDGFEPYPYGCQYADVHLSEDWTQIVRPLMDQIGSHMSDDKPFGLNMIPWAYIPAIRTHLPSDFDWVSERITDDGKAGIEWPDSSLVFDSQWVEKMFRRFYYDLKIKDQYKYREFLNTARVAYRCATNISREVLRGFPGNYTSHREEILNPTDYHDAYDYDGSPIEGFEADRLIAAPYVHPGMDTMIVEDANGDRGQEYVGNLSAGTQGTYLWTLYLALKMALHQNALFDKEPFTTAWDKQPAILLIDEIENHLHPTWQRRVIPALLEHFPGLQIFATTHSPFEVAGLKAGQVHMLKRGADGVVTASTNEQDIIGWTTDEILRTFMEVDEPTDQLTIDRAQRLRELRGKESLTDEEAVEIEELRRQVNEDFLSSSTPLEAQRERYGDMMLEFLRSRQSELSQDGD